MSLDGDWRYPDQVVSPRNSVGVRGGVSRHSFCLQHWNAIAPYCARKSVFSRPRVTGLSAASFLPVVNYLGCKLRTLAVAFCVDVGPRLAASPCPSSEAAGAPHFTSLLPLDNVTRSGRPLSRLSNQHARAGHPSFDTGARERGKGGDEDRPGGAGGQRELVQAAVLVTVAVPVLRGLSGYTMEPRPRGWWQQALSSRQYSHIRILIERSPWNKYNFTRR